MVINTLLIVKVEWGIENVIVWQGVRGLMEVLGRDKKDHSGTGEEERQKAVRHLL